MNGRPILGLLAIGVLALVLSALGGGGEAAGASLAPACPETWPEATGWHEGWYVIIDRDSNGNKHGRAYPADSRYRLGYVPGAPHEVCIVRIKDNPGVYQLLFGADRDRTQTTPVAGAESDTTSPGQQGSGNSCPSDYRHQHDSYEEHWHQWSINRADGQCFHHVGHNGPEYHEH